MGGSGVKGEEGWSMELWRKGRERGGGGGAGRDGGVGDESLY